MASARPIFHVSGSGNDFLALIEPESPPGVEEVRGWTRRGVSIGADGVFTLHRQGDVARMVYWNADGTRADLCGNATRCAAQLAFELGWVEPDHEARIETDAGVFAGRRVSPERIDLDAPPPGPPPEKKIAWAAGRSWSGYHLVVGVPYFVTRWSGDLEHAPVAEAGPLLRHHEVFGEAGANVDFVRYTAPHRLDMRVYERGVEAETLASGTGMLAAARVGLELGLLELPVEAHTRSGFPARIRGALGDEGRLVSWSLEGDARLVARVEPLPGALARPVC
jgi:diaminopimelate epimerase